MPDNTGESTGENGESTDNTVESTDNPDIGPGTYGPNAGMSVASDGTDEAHLGWRI